MTEIDAKAAIAAGQGTIRSEARALDELAAALDGPLAAPFAAAVGHMQRTKGRVIVTGMGKSGHIARKIAATLASTGRPALFVHPAEASHGDLGMITDADCVLAISRSGDVIELADILHHCRRLKIPLIGMTMRAASVLGTASDIVLLLPDCGEASEAAPAPTTSTTMCLALGDALAIALLDAAGFTSAHFGAIHPGGKLGAMLKRVSDIMRPPSQLVAPQVSVSDTLKAIHEGGIGAVGVTDRGVLIGIITDGDLHRRLSPEMFTRNAQALMTANPMTIAADAPIADAIAIMNAKRITVLFVADHGAPVGVVHMHDLLAAGIR